MVLSLVRLEFFSFPQHSDRLWGPSNLLYDEYCYAFLLGPSRESVMLTTHFRLVLRLEYMQLYHHLYTHLHDIVLNQAGVNLSFMLQQPLKLDTLFIYPCFNTESLGILFMNDFLS